MKSNVTPLDGAIRGGLGMLLLTSPLLNVHSYPYNFLGLVLVATSFGWCPLYALGRSLVGLEPAPAKALRHAR
jgi:hypothetical protein